MKKVIIAGASGMIGGLVLKGCLSSDEISDVTILVRKPLDIKHPKLEEVVMPDLLDFSKVDSRFQNVDIAFFCIGVYTGQVPDELFKKVTIDIPIAFANAIKKGSPSANLCFLSGGGADRSEKSRVAFARYKGMAENHLSAMNLGGFFSFRPGYIYPVTLRKAPNLMYRISRSLYPLIRLFGKNASIKSTELAQAMIKVGLEGAKDEVLENRDILRHIG